MGSLVRKVQQADIASLLPFPGNARRGDVPAIAASLQANGQFAPLVVQASTRYVLSGNHTMQAAQSLGWVKIAVVLVDVDDARALRINLAANRTSDRGTYDDRALLEQLRLAADLDGTGYLPDDLDGLAALISAADGIEAPPDETEIGAEDATPVPSEPVTRQGDTWLLGPHRLHCGSSLDSEAAASLLDGIVPHLVYTDPPYGISAVPKDGGVSRGGYGPGKRKGERGAKRIQAQRFDPVVGDETTETVRESFARVQELCSGAIQVWWGANHYAASAGLPDASCWLVWDKANGALDFADCELAWTNHPGAVRKLTHLWNGMLRASERDRPRVHPTQKPVALAVWAFSRVDLKGTAHLVYDPFLGSGSTLLAADATDRIAYGMEISPGYCDVACRRYQQLTGTLPVRESTGEQHSFVEGAP